VDQESTQSMTASTTREAVFSAIRAQWEGAALLAAHKAGVFGAFAQSSVLTTEEVCEATGITQRAAAALLGTLITTGWLTQLDGDDQLEPTEKSRPIIDGDAPLLGYLNLHADLREYWAHFEDHIQCSGAKNWDYFNDSQDSRLIEEYSCAMNALGEDPAHELWQKLPVAGTERILDLGGGGGIYGHVLRQMHPGCHVSVLERPLVCDVVQKSAALNEPQIKYIAGSYLSYETTDQYDTVLCCNTVHHESNSSLYELMRTAKACLAPQGRVILVDYFCENEQYSSPLGFAAMLLAMSPHGQIHELQDVITVAESIGLRLEDKWGLSAGLKVCSFRSTEGVETP